MVLTNAEKQRRFRERRDALAKIGAFGVTPEMIERAARLMWDRARAADIASGASDPGTFEERAAYWRRKNGRAEWFGLLPERDDPEEWAQFGDDAELMAKVAAVVRVVRNGPAG